MTPAPCLATARDGMAAIGTTASGTSSTTAARIGRLASHAAALLRGKHKATFAPHMDMGDFVIIINADKVALTGQKLQKKKAYRHSGYPGGLKSVTYEELLAKNPERAVEKAVRGMLPKNSLGAQQLTKLKVYRGAEHPHGAQQPKTFTLDQVAQ